MNTSKIGLNADKQLLKKFSCQCYKPMVITIIDPNNVLVNKSKLSFWNKTLCLCLCIDIKCLLMFGTHREPLYPANCLEKYFSLSDYLQIHMYNHRIHKNKYLSDVVKSMLVRHHRREMLVYQKEQIRDKYRKYWLDNWTRAHSTWISVIPQRTLCIVGRFTDMQQTSKHNVLLLQITCVHCCQPCM